MEKTHWNISSPLLLKQTTFSTRSPTNQPILAFVKPQHKLTPWYGFWWHTDNQPLRLTRMVRSRKVYCYDWEEKLVAGSGLPLPSSSGAWTTFCHRELQLDTWDNHLPWSDHDQELFVVDLAILIFIGHREHVKNLLSRCFFIREMFWSRDQTLWMSKVS